MRRLLSLFLMILSAYSYVRGQEVDTLARFRNLDSLYLKQSLEGITIVGHNPSSNISTEKVQYRVVDDPERKTQSIMELLRKVPMVTVDARNNITVNGSSEFLIYINGRPSTSATRNPEKVLRSMSANSVLRIEVITNPGAKYDAEGVGGILNIITKKDKVVRKEEMSGSVHTLIGNNRWGENVNLEMNKGAWTLDAGVSLSYEYQPHSPMMAVIQHKTNVPFEERCSMDAQQRYPFVLGNVDLGYQIDTLSEVHLSLAASYMEMCEKGPSTNFLTGAEQVNGIELLSNNLSSFRGTSLDGCLDYQRALDSEQRGKMSFAYQFSFNPNRIMNQQTYLDRLLAQQYGFDDYCFLNKNVGMLHHFLSDYELVAAKWLKINTGAKYSLEDDRSDAFQQRQHIIAAYVESEMNYRWLEAKAGLRYEYTWQKSMNFNSPTTSFQLHYGLLAPSVNITAMLHKNHKLGLSYSLRVRRPDIEMLDPFEHHYDAFAVEYGNPQLNAEKTHALTLGYTMNLKRISLNAIVHHSVNRNSIQRYTFMLDGLLHTTYGNVAQNRSTGLNIFMSTNLTATTRLMVNSEVSYVDLRSRTLSAHNRGWSFNGNVGLQQTLPWKLKLSINVEMMTREYTLQGWESGMAMMSASLSRSFVNDRWMVALSGSIGLSKHGDFVWRTYTETSDFLSEYTYLMPGKNIQLSVSYAFGSKKNEYGGLCSSKIPMRRRSR